MIKATHIRTHLDSGEEFARWEYPLNLDLAAERPKGRAWASLDPDHRTAELLPDGSIVMTVEGMSALDTYIYAEAG